MEAYCVFIAGSFVALPAFTSRYGKYDETEGKWFIVTSWQSALQMGGPVGAFIGVFLAGPITSWIGYRWATIGGLMALNGFIFIFYFGDSLGAFLGAQILEGIPWGIFIANSPAYCSEIVPLRLRAPCTQMLQMFWALGAIIVGGVCYAYNEDPRERAYRCVTSICNVPYGMALLT
jgi:MFS transporter, SP family, general alpha glucoside:H+ symporter